MYWGNWPQPMTITMTWPDLKYFSNARTLTTAGLTVSSETEPALLAALSTGSERWRNSLSAPPSTTWGNSRNISITSRPPVFRLVPGQIADSPILFSLSKELLRTTGCHLKCSSQQFKIMKTTETEMLWINDWVSEVTHILLKLDGSEYNDLLLRYFLISTP